MQPWHGCGSWPPLLLPCSFEISLELFHCECHWIIWKNEWPHPTMISALSIPSDHIWPKFTKKSKSDSYHIIWFIYIYIYISKLSNSLHPKNPPPINRANMRVCCQLLTCTKLPISTSRLSKGRVGLVRFPAVMPSHDTIPDDIIIIRHLKKSHLVHTIILSINVRFRNVYPMLSFFFTLNLENW